ncbi:Ionotropic receptor 163 [Diabrotica virgifera virgifera]|nr:Ionotropic receptor 163 [Diabrotica virgifera virgifera]
MKSLVLVYYRIYMYFVVLLVCDCDNFDSTTISSLEKCVSHILKSTVSHKDVVYVVNTDLKISYPAIYINTSYDVNLLLQQEPTVYVLTGHIDDVIAQLFHNSLLNPRAKFILVQSTVNNKTDIFNHYFLHKVLIIEYKIEEHDYQLFKCTTESCYVTEDSCYKTYINGTIFDISKQVVCNKMEVIWTLHAPYIITPTSGVHMKIINLIAAHMNVKLKYIHSPYPVVPLAVDPLFSRNEYDMCSIQFTNLTKKFDKTIFITEDRTVYIIPRIIVTKELQMFYSEFDELIWYHFLILILLLFVLFRVMHALIPKTNVLSAFDVILGVLLEGVTSMNTRSFSLKLLLINYILFCLLFSTAYKSKMFDKMKTDLSGQLISTTDDLLKYGFKVALPEEYVKLFKLSQDRFDRIIVARNWIVNCLNFSICLDRVAFQKDVVTTRLLRPTKALIAQYYLDSEGRSLLYIIKNPFGVSYYFSLLFRKGHPLFEDFNKYIFLLREAGFVNYLVKDQQRSYKKAIALANIKSSFRYSALNLKILESTFFVYFLGMGCSIVVFFLELSFQMLNKICRRELI